ncbi:MAG: hypothetical protein CMF50_01460 [Legionellales bacterium]|nr:hypothetical protein [Legionellales bacterium]
MGRLLLSIVLIYVLVAVFLYLFQRQIIYRPGYGPTGDHWALPKGETITLTTNDGLSLQAWYRPAQRNLPTLLIFHGNAGAINLRSYLVTPYLIHGYGVFLFDYRGYGGNPGKPTETGLYKDGEAAVNYLRQRVKPRCIVYYGESLGTGVAVEMALHYPPAALVLQSPYSSLGDVGSYHYPFLPVKLLMKDKYTSIEKITRLHIPVLMMHGSSDTIVPAKLGERLFVAANQPKQWQSFEVHGHNDMPSMQMFQATDKFLREQGVCQ